MDLFAVQQAQGTLGRIARQCAFFCFVVACALLGASLVLPGTGLLDNGYLASAIISGPPPR